jgi:GNAT superfamily N-acetyltransferase
MVPFIQNGDFLIIEPVKASGLDIGDVAFYRFGRDRLVVHRIIEREVKKGHEIFTMRGDAADSFEDKIRTEQVLGRVVSVWRGEKFISLDGGARRWMALLWVRISPLVPSLFQLARVVKKTVAWFLTMLQGLKPYRVLAKRLIGTKVRYRIATPEDSRLFSYKIFPEMADPVGEPDHQFNSLKGFGYTLIALVRDQIAGTAIIRRFPEKELRYTDWWLFGMLVRTRYRGSGIGEGMMRMALEKASEEKGAKMNLLVFKYNKAAINLYLKMGFIQTSIPDLDDQLEKEVRLGENRRIIMTKPL